jgi:hypothetical protein
VISVVIPAVAIPTVMVSVPAMIVIESPAVAVPISGVPAIAIVPRFNPARTDVGRTGPIAVVPAIPAVDDVPVAVDPDVLRPGTRRKDSYDAWRGRRSDSNPDRNLSDG